jgi:hypothetical protein
MWWKVFAIGKHIGLQTIISAKFIDWDNGFINNHKHRVGIDKISYSMS